jgi:hypothetical protein
MSENSLCYVLFCYRDVDSVSFLLAALYRPCDAFLIHCDPKAPARLHNYLQELCGKFSNIDLLPAQPYSWAGYSHVAASLRALAIAQELPIDWSHVIFLSEQHVPLKPPDEIARRLHSRESVVALRKFSEMAEGEQLDLRNRFGAIYHELPGVGSFAVGLPNWRRDFVDDVYHGSNWLALSRKHSDVVLTGDATGALDVFRQVVHAEETAIQSILGPVMGKADLNDVTLVAWPHLTDNHNLIFNEALFESGLLEEHLFIRKRPLDLKEEIKSRIKAFSFNHEIYGLGDNFSNLPPPDRFYREEYAISKLEAFLAKRRFRWTVQRYGAGNADATPRLHLVITSSSMPSRASIRIISQDMMNFKICLLWKTERVYPLIAPFIDGSSLISVARIRVHDVFGYIDILPLELEEYGFVRSDVLRSLSFEEIINSTIRLHYFAADPQNWVNREWMSR